MADVEPCKRRSHGGRHLPHDRGKPVEVGLVAAGCAHCDETPPEDRRVRGGHDLRRPSVGVVVAGRRLDADAVERGPDLVDVHAPTGAHRRGEGSFGDAPAREDVREQVYECGGGLTGRARVEPAVVRRGVDAANRVRRPPSSQPRTRAGGRSRAFPTRVRPAFGWSAAYSRTRR